ncbi:MAG: hypothetical protein A4E49_02461 [Methanosaeta sp. PtaU1.Bin112]|nr:MAG: hypothetical protein A4E49_02461 [Methanosaeta sp. PtaU1.Bin112]
MLQEVYAPALTKCTNGDFVVIVPEFASRRYGIQLRCYWKNNKTAGAPWEMKDLFGNDVTSAPALIQSSEPKTDGRLEVVVREKGNVLRHYWCNPIFKEGQDWQWQQGDKFAENVKSKPAIVENPNNRNIEVVFWGVSMLEKQKYQPDVLQQWWGDKASCPSACPKWKPGLSSFGVDVASGPSMIYSTYGNYEIVYCDSNSKIRLLWIPVGFQMWQEVGKPFGENIASDPVLIQSDLDNGTKNFEVMYRDNFGQLRHWYRDNNDPKKPWNPIRSPEKRPICIGNNVLSGPSLITSGKGNKGNFDVVVVEASDSSNGYLMHYWRDNDDPICKKILIVCPPKCPYWKSEIIGKLPTITY